mgnify:CR=1 FL=1
MNNQNSIIVSEKLSATILSSRKKLGLSQGELSKQCGKVNGTEIPIISTSTLSNIETKRQKSLSYSAYHALKEVLGFDWRIVDTNFLILIERDYNNELINILLELEKVDPVWILYTESIDTQPFFNKLRWIEKILDNGKSDIALLELKQEEINIIKSSSKLLIIAYLTKTMILVGLKKTKRLLGSSAQKFLQDLNEVITIRKMNTYELLFTSEWTL